MTQDHKKPTLTRDQTRAKWAYETYKGLSDGDKADFKVAVHALGPNIIRSGLVAALAFLQRTDNAAAGMLFAALAKKEALGLLILDLTDKELPSKVQNLDVEVYMLVTRETLKLTQWLKRAVQAHKSTQKTKSA
jgi:CRISPR/Cas system CMR-associated protein Cmr5 small subunit